MSLRKVFKTDKDAEISGVWQDVGFNEHNKKPIRIHISRMSGSNKRYSSELERVTKPHQASIQNGAFSNDLARELLQKVFVDTVLLGWDNVPLSDLTGKDEDDDKTVDYSKENALALFAEMPDLYDDWEKRAQAASNFREENAKVAAGNSQAS